VSDPPPILEAREVRFAYPRSGEVLHGVSLAAQPGRLVCLLGPNGSGKTTLLRCLLGQLDPSTGEVLLDGERIGRHSRRQLARKLAYVPQTPRSAFAFSSWEIVLSGRFAHSSGLGLASEHDHAVAREAMSMTDTLHFAQRTLDELSGGEAQRVMLARALAQQPAVLLLDEPTSHLDIRNQLAIYDLMRRVAHDWPMAVVCVSHDLNVAGRFADEIALLRDGAMLADGPAGDVLTADAISAAYDVDVDLIDAPGSDVPMVRARMKPQPADRDRHKREDR
jgi:iron complex transport system ATP-binding protein